MNIDKQKIKEQIAPIKDTTSEFIAVVMQFEIKDQDGADLMTQIMDEAHATLKDLETKRKSITKPLNDATTAANKLFKPATALAEELKALTKKKLVDWEVAQREKEAEQLKSLGPKEIVKITSGRRPSPVVLRKQYLWEVTDFDKIPREFLCLDKSAVKIAIDNADDPSELNIPGLKITVENTGSVRAGARR